MRTGLPNQPQPLPTPTRETRPPAPQNGNTAQTAEAARQAALQQAAASQAAMRQAAERLMSLTAQYRFRHASAPRNPLPPPNVPLQRRPPPRPNAQAARPRAAQQQQQPNEAAHPRDEHEHELGSGDPAADGDRERKRGKMDFDTDDRSDNRDSFHGQRDGSGRDRPRNPLKARTAPRRGQPPATQVLARSGLMEAAALFVRHGPQARDPKVLLESLCAVLVSCAGMSPGAPNKPTPAATVLAALQVHLASQQEAPPDPLTLDQVKAMLLARYPAPSPSAATGPAAQNAWLLLPLQLLNATRPRTPQQVQHAVDRLTLLRTTQGLA